MVAIFMFLKPFIMEISPFRYIFCYGNTAQRLCGVAIRLFCFVFSKQTTSECIGEVLYSDISHAPDDI